MLVTLTFKCEGMLLTFRFKCEVHESDPRCKMRG